MTESRCFYSRASTNLAHHLVVEKMAANWPFRETCSTRWDHTSNRISLRHRNKNADVKLEVIVPYVKNDLEWQKVLRKN